MKHDKSALILMNTKRFASLRSVTLLLGTLLLAACQSSGIYQGVPVDTAVGSSANIESLTAVIDSNPRDAGAYNTRGIAYGQAGKLDKAIADFNTALQLDPQSYQAYANRALVHRRLGQIQPAISDYTRAINIKPDYDVAYVGRGNAYRQLGQYGPALNDFNAVIARNSSDARAFHNRGLIHQAQGQHQRAIEDFATAIGLNPNADEPYIARGISYLAIDERLSRLTATDRSEKAALHSSCSARRKMRGGITTRRSTSTPRMISQEKAWPA